MPTEPTVPPDAAARAACWYTAQPYNSAGYSEHPADCGSCKAIAAAIRSAVEAERAENQRVTKTLRDLAEGMAMMRQEEKK